MAVLLLRWAGDAARRSYLERTCRAERSRRLGRCRPRMCETLRYRQVDVSTVLLVGQVDAIQFDAVNLTGKAP